MSIRKEVINKVRALLAEAIEQATNITELEMGTNIIHMPRDDIEELLRELALAQSLLIPVYEKRAKKVVKGILEYEICNTTTGLYFRCYHKCNKPTWSSTPHIVKFDTLEEVNALLLRLDAQYSPQKISAKIIKVNGAVKVTQSQS